MLPMDTTQETYRVTGADAVAYLQRVAPERQWSHDEHCVLELHGEAHGPTIHAHIVELHWMKGGVVGARGIPLWVF